MESRHRIMHWVGAWLLLLCCRSALLLKPSATFWPTQLNQSTGTTAEFTCNISNAEVFEDSVNWYKFDANKQPGKLDTRNKNKYEITRLDTQTFRMKILNLERNDSGVYSCILVATHSSLGFTESNHGNLTVTEIAPTPGSPEDEYESDHDAKENENAGHNIPLAAIGALGLVLVSVLASLCFFLIKVIRRRQERGKPHDENAPLEEEPPAVAVFTVDYGVLEFQARKNARRPPFPPPSPKPQPLDQTEYATIIFPTEKSVPMENTGKLGPMENTKRTKRQVRWVPTGRQQLH
ncbi:programmed cell death protein 1 [Anolis carolinensis]|uniref:programmed cell death protein 1 n=1 Tax=Anolis carolinensis TaxID=28377 RepID=UPI002F2B4187